jgi:hypothetical protein
MTVVMFADISARTFSSAPICEQLHSKENGLYKGDGAHSIKIGSRILLSHVM